PSSSVSTTSPPTPPAATTRKFPAAVPAGTPPRSPLAPRRGPRWQVPPAHPRPQQRRNGFTLRSTPATVRRRSRIAARVPDVSSPARCYHQAAPAKRPKRKFTMTAKARAARKRQGQYLAALRKLKGVERTRVKAVARKEGVAKAVELARKLAKAVPAKAA